MSNLAHQTCRNHAGREAVARCPECRRYFCRECVTEHEDRVVCSTCLAQLAAAGKRKAWRVSGILQFAQFAAGLLLIWLSFYLVGRALLNVPSEFHERSLWAVSPLEQFDDQ